MWGKSIEVTWSFENLNSFTYPTSLSCPLENIVYGSEYVIITREVKKVICPSVRHFTIYALPLVPIETERLSGRTCWGKPLCCKTTACPKLTAPLDTGVRCHQFTFHLYSWWMFHIVCVNRSNKFPKCRQQSYINHNKKGTSPSVCYEAQLTLWNNW